MKKGIFFSFSFVLICLITSMINAVTLTEEQQNALIVQSAKKIGEHTQQINNLQNQSSSVGKDDIDLSIKAKSVELWGPHEINILKDQLILAGYCDSQTDGFINTLRKNAKGSKEQIDVAWGVYRQALKDGPNMKLLADLVRRVETLECQYKGLEALAAAMPTNPGCDGKPKFIPVVSVAYVDSSIATAKADGLAEGKTYVDQKTEAIQTQVDKVKVTAEGANDKAEKAQAVAEAAQKDAKDAAQLNADAIQSVKEQADRTEKFAVELACGKKDEVLARLYASCYNGSSGVKGFKDILPSSWSEEDKDKKIKKLHEKAIALGLISPPPQNEEAEEE